MLERLLHGNYNHKIYYKLGRCYLRNKILRRPAISSIEIINTLNCNAHCKFCSNYKLSPNQQTMRREVAYKTLEQVVMLKIPMVIFLGGEGLLDKNIFDYFNFCKRNDIIIQYATNGSLLTEETIDMLVRHGVSQVCVTLHDDSREKHDETCGIPDSFERIIKAFRIMKRRGMIVLGKTIYSKESLENGSFRRVLDLCKREKILLAANPYMPVGRAATPHKLLDKKEVKAYYRMCRDENINDHIYNGWNRGCIAGKTYFGILTSGQILPCYFLPISVGNVMELRMDEAIKICAEIPLFARKHMICPVAHSEILYKEIIQPLYGDNSIDLPVDITKRKDLFERLMSLRV